MTALAENAEQLSRSGNASILVGVGIGSCVALLVFWNGLDTLFRCTSHHTFSLGASAYADTPTGPLVLFLSNFLGVVYNYCLSFGCLRLADTLHSDK